MSTAAIYPQLFETFTINVPKVDLERFKGLTKAMGWTFEKCHANVNVRALAQKICTEDEYQQLLAEGFLDNPHPQFGPFSDEEIVERIKGAEAEEYLTAEESSAWMERLADEKMEEELKELAPLTDADFPEVSREQFVSYVKAASGKMNQTVSRWL